MLIRRPADIRSSEITPESIYEKRRQFIKGGAGLILAASAADVLAVSKSKYGGTPMRFNPTNRYGTDEELTPYKDVTSYNNFYEFGTDKYSPAKRAHTLQTDPWSIKVDGYCERPGSISMEDILRSYGMQERTYRMRCVEGWSMVIPWIGFPLYQLLKRFQPTSKAKFVEFKTLHDPVQMPGQKRRVLSWPYIEGLRMDEAMHPLTILATGLYGETMPKQNGAPLRLVVPWKYGFKEIKSIVQISFVEHQPVSSWMRAAPSEYGFYSNVNPLVDHPRWSQKRERRIGEFLKRKTLMFNGYGEHVTHMYSGMDLKKYY